MYVHFEGLKEYVYVSICLADDTEIVYVRCS